MPQGDVSPLQRHIVLFRKESPDFSSWQHLWILYLDVQRKTSIDAHSILHPLEVARAFHGIIQWMFIH